MCIHAVASPPGYKRDMRVSDSLVNAHGKYIRERGIEQTTKADTLKSNITGSLENLRFVTGNDQYRNTFDNVLFRSGCTFIKIKCGILI